MNLEDKVVLVTGSSGGLGAQICYEAAKQGAIVISCARRMAFVEGVRDECRRLSGKEAYAFKVDVSNPESVDELYEKVMEEDAYTWFNSLNAIRYMEVHISEEHTV